MSSIWSAVNIAGTGTAVDQTWMDAIGSNISNMNDAVTPGKPVYRAQYVVVGESTTIGSQGSPNVGAGVHVNAIALGPANGENQYQPSNPIANAQGEVTYPVVDLGSQLTDMVQAQMSYEANAQVMSHAKTAYSSILNIRA